MKPQVSIIVPVYNVEKYLDDCIQSLIYQTIKDIEIILVDDGSTDGCPKMCDDYTKQDSRIKVVHKKNAGLGMACNTGIEMATGDYIAFCDSDDWVDEDMYQTMYDAAIEYDSQMVFTGLRRVDVNGKQLELLPHKEHLHIYKGDAEIDALACDMVSSEPASIRERTIQMSAKVVLYSRQIVTANNLRFVSEREIMSEDLHFNLNVLSHCSCVCVLPIYKYNYRYRPSSITLSLDTDLFARIKALYFYTNQECQDLGIGRDVRQRVQRMFIGYVRNHIRSISRSSLSISQQYRAIRMILCDDVWTKVWSEYPIRKMSAKYRVSVELMRKRCVFLLRTMLKWK